MAEITASRISEYKAKRLAAVRKIGEGAAAVERRLTAAAVNRPLALIGHLFRLAHEEWGELDVVPKIRTEKEPPGRLRWLGEDEARRLWAACRKSRNPALADLVEFCLFTGLRQGALGLTWDRVDRSRGVVRLELTTSCRRREVPLGSNADAVLARRWTGGAKGYVFGSCKWNSFRSAWEAALAAAGIEDDPGRTVYGRYDRLSGYEATLELLRRDPTLTAVVAANDTVALGACAALRDSGLRIPDDVSVAGFDDLPFSIDAVPALTTVRLPLAEAGARAGRIAMGREEAPHGGIATVRGELMVRGSTGSPRAK